VTDRFFTTNGNPSTSPIFMDVLPLSLRNIGPFLGAITIHAELKNASSSTNFEFDVEGQWSMDGETWKPFSSLLMQNQSDDGQRISG